MGKEKRGATGKKKDGLPIYQIGFFSSFFLKQDNALICDDDSPFSKRGTRKGKKRRRVFLPSIPGSSHNSLFPFSPEILSVGKTRENLEKSRRPRLTPHFVFSLSSLQYTDNESWEGGPSASKEKRRETNNSNRPPSRIANAASMVDPFCFRLGGGGQGGELIERKLMVGEIKAVDGLCVGTARIHGASRYTSTRTTILCPPCTNCLFM
ncbi:hypothetical protein V8C43DRAFT_92303 [Trichoderma afarasin]